jgi:hypothetical protein
MLHADEHTDPSSPALAFARRASPRPATAGGGLKGDQRLSPGRDTPPKSGEEMTGRHVGPATARDDASLGSTSMFLSGWPPRVPFRIALPSHGVWLVSTRGMMRLAWGRCLTAADEPHERGGRGGWGGAGARAGAFGEGNSAVAVSSSVSCDKVLGPGSRGGAKAARGEGGGGVSGVVACVGGSPRILVRWTVTPLPRTGRVGHERVGTRGRNAAAGGLRGEEASASHHGARRWVAGCLMVSPGLRPGVLIILSRPCRHGGPGPDAFTRAAGGALLAASHQGQGAGSRGVPMGAGDWSRVAPCRHGRARAWRLDARWTQPQGGGVGRGHDRPSSR